MPCFNQEPHRPHGTFALVRWRQYSAASQHHHSTAARCGSTITQLNSRGCGVYNESVIEQKEPCKSAAPSAAQGLKEAAEAGLGKLDEARAEACRSRTAMAQVGERDEEAEWLLALPRGEGRTRMTLTKETCAESLSQK